MALPRLFQTQCVRKVVMFDGNVLLAFRVDQSNDSLSGYMRVVVTAAVAADFTEGTNYDGSFNAG